MKEEYIQEILDRLKTGALSEYYVKQDEFMDFRAVIVKREDFKHFRGIAQRGGEVLYQYLETARS